MLNQVVLQGNLTKSAELRYWQNGTAYCDFSVAVNKPYKDKQTGEWKAIANYFDCRMKGKFAEAYSKHLLKGRKVSLIGELEQQRWEQDGQKFSRVIIEVEKLSPEWGKQNNEQNNGVQQDHQSQQNYNNAQQQKSYNAVNNAFVQQSEDTWVDFNEAELPEDIPF